MSREQYKLIDQIISRAEQMEICRSKRITHFIDLGLAVETFNLKLEEWLNADDINFAHDFLGIYNNINRVTQEFENCFVPRFAEEV